MKPNPEGKTTADAEHTVDLLEMISELSESIKMLLNDLKMFKPMKENKTDGKISGGSAIQQVKKSAGTPFWLTSKDVLSLIHISKRTLQNYRDKGIIPYKKFNGRCYYHKDDINKLFGQTNNRTQ